MRNKYKLYGAILGDLAGQPYEFPPMKGPYTKVKIHNPDSHITDDTVMTLASAFSIIHETPIGREYKYWARKYPDAGYGKGFKAWVDDKRDVQGDSYGNGCIMRASPFMYTKDLPGLIRSVQCSHNHEDSLTAAFWLWECYVQGLTTKGFVIKKFDKFEVNAKATMNFCMCAADHNRTTHANIIGAIEHGGDTDTNASIVGEMSNFWLQDITKKDAEYVESKLDKFQLETLIKFNKKFNT